MTPALYPPAPASRQSDKPRHARNTFHAVSVQHAVKACDGARRLQSMRYLSRDAPQLPLAECKAARCECRYIHHEDRRCGEDRRDICAPALPVRDDTRLTKQRRASAADLRSERSESSWLFLSR